MTVAELVTLIHGVRRGAAVQLTSINIPEHSKGGLYAIVTIGGRNGRSDLELGVHTEEELADVLRRHR